jgi:hypothetical protein
MPTVHDTGIASFFGGLARGLSARQQRKEQEKAAEKAAELKMSGDILQAGLQAGTIKNPEESMAWYMEQLGIKDPKFQQKIRNIMTQARTIVPTLPGPGQSPGTAIGLGQPGGGQEPAATGPQASPGRSVGLMAPDRAPGPPQFYSADELESRNLQHETAMAKIKGDQDVRVANARAEASGDTKVVSRQVVTGDELGAGYPPKQRFQVTNFASGRQQIEPMEAKAESKDNSPEGRLRQALIDTGMPEDQAKLQAAKQTLALSQLDFTKTLLGNQTATERLSQLRQRGPILAQIAQLHASDLAFTAMQRQAMAAGDPKTLLDVSRGLAAKAVTDKGTPDFGADPLDVQDRVLKEMGYPGRDELMKQVHPPSATQQEIDAKIGGGATGGGAAGGKTPALAVGSVKWGTTPKDIQADIAKQFQGAGTYTHTAADGTKTTWKINADGTVTAGK